MLLICIIVASASVAESAPKSSDTDVHCGSRCLYVALSGLGFEPLDLDEVKSRLGPPPADGYTFGQLELAAQSYGAHTLGVETTAQNLTRRSPPFACVAHLTHDHFVLITDISANSATLIDPPRENTVPLDTLSAVWDRKALLISSQPLAGEHELVGDRRFSVLVLGAVIVGGVGVAILGWHWNRRRIRNQAA